MKSMLAAIGVMCVGLATASLAGNGQRSGIDQRDVFVAGTEGYHTFRIPAVIRTKRDTLLAFCEGRKGGRGDSGDIDTVLKRSTDGGKSWSPLQVVWDEGANTVGNACPVVDRTTGVIWLLLTRNLGHDTETEIINRTAERSREVWVCKSADDGVTWSKPVDITATAKAPDWTWYATGPGVGIQLKNGRMLIPCDHNVAVTKMRRSHVIYSDDHGATWKRGGVVGDLTNECQAAELKDGSVLINMRSYHGKNRRAVSTSRDGGLSWSEITLDETLIEPVCQASLIALPPRSNTLLFSNPASVKRENLTLRHSRDGGKTWPKSLTLHAGPSAYSCLTALPGRRFGCLYERGDANPYERITFARLELKLLTEAAY
ncbi:MAG: sialidase family protein [Actinomycetota bacterium]